MGILRYSASTNLSGEEFLLPSTAAKTWQQEQKQKHIIRSVCFDTDFWKQITDFKQLPALKKTKMVMYSITSNFNLTLGTSGKAVQYACSKHNSYAQMRVMYQ